MPAPTEAQRAAWTAAKAALDAVEAERAALLKPTDERYLTAIEAVEDAEDACQPVSRCEGCGEPIFVGDLMLAGETDLCGDCSPTIEDLLKNPESFADAEGEPLTAAAAKAWFDQHIAVGGKPTDSMATVVTD